MFKNRLTVSNILLCLFGNVILALGVALADTGALGIDPFNGMCMSVSHVLHFPYAPFVLIFDLLLFIGEAIFGKRYVFLGTFVNWFLFSYVVTFFKWLYDVLGFAMPGAFVPRLLFLIAGLLGMGLGLAMYQHADLGVAPYDSIPLILHDRFPRFPFFAGRVGIDALMLIIILLVGNPVNKIGIGTVLTAFGLGPVISMFTVLLFGKDGKQEKSK